MNYADATARTQVQQAREMLEEALRLLGSSAAPRPPLAYTISSAATQAAQAVANLNQAYGRMCAVQDARDPSKLGRDFC